MRDPAIRRVGEEAGNRSSGYDAPSSSGIRSRSHDRSSSRRPRMSSPDFLAQPRTSDEPIALDGLGRDAEGRGGVVEGEAGKEPTLHDIGAPRVHHAQALEGLVDEQQLIGFGNREKFGHVVEWDGSAPAPRFSRNRARALSTSTRRMVAAPR